MKTILIVDDELDITTTFSLLFELRGFEALTAANGAAALALLQEKTPDLIISDYMMPVMDGLAFARQIKAEAATRHIPLILMSGVMPQEALGQAPFDAFLQKPFQFTVLLQTASKLLKPQ